MKMKEFSFVFLSVTVHHHRALSPRKQNKKKKTYSTKSLLDSTALQITSRICLKRFHGYCCSSEDNHAMVVFEGLLDE